MLAWFLEKFLQKSNKNIVCNIFKEHFGKIFWRIFRPSFRNSLVLEKRKTNWFVLKTFDWHVMDSFSKTNYRFHPPGKMGINALSLCPTLAAPIAQNVFIQSSTPLPFPWEINATPLPFGSHHQIGLEENHLVRAFFTRNLEDDEGNEDIMLMVCKIFLPGDSTTPNLRPRPIPPGIVCRFSPSVRKHFFYLRRWRAREMAGEGTEGYTNRHDTIICPTDSLTWLDEDKICPLPDASESTSRLRDRASEPPALVAFHGGQISLKPLKNPYLFPKHAFYPLRSLPTSQF